MEGLGAPQSPPPAATAISAVLDDDDLLCEILLCVEFPTSLVRAALVCKRWLRLSSDPVFICRFGDLHPPSLLGFYVETGGTKPRFLPMPQPTELAAMVRRANMDLGTLGSDSFGLSVDCLDGLLLITSYLHHGPPTRTVRYPLYPSRYTTILPPVPQTCIHDERLTYDEGKILPNSSGGDGLSFLYLALGVKGQQTIVDVYAIQHDVWAIYSSVASELTGISLRLDIGSLIGDGMIYTLAYGSEIDKLFVLDLVSASLSLVNLPEKVSSWCGKLSLADDSGVYLISLKDLQIRIWLHKMDSNGAANWFLVNTICLRAICADHMIPSQGLEDGDVHAAGFNSEFVFIEAGDALYLFDIKRKVIKKVYQVTEEDDFVYSVSPFMMVWPPKFPLVKEGRDLKE